MPEVKLDLTGDGGVMKNITKEGIGSETPSEGCTVSVHYTGKFLDGTVFDSSLAPEKNEPLQFVLGGGSMIAAFDIGVASMKKGEKATLTCSPKYSQGMPNMPNDAPIIFEVEMLDWKPEDISPNSDGSIQRVILRKASNRKNPNEGAHVKINLVGKHEGHVFDERQVEFEIGDGIESGIVEGIEIALLKMALNETSRIILHSKYAFGDAGNPGFDIPPKATVEYIISLKECERAIDEWKLNEDECLAQAKIFKEKGTKYLRMDKWELAIKKYKKSMNYLSNYEIDAYKPYNIALHLNLALCYIKLGDYFEAKAALNEVLGKDPANVKGLYRRGQCHLGVGDYENALEDFQKVHEIEPENKAASNQITICKQKIKEFYKKEKSVYANMFTKFAAADKQYYKEKNTQKEDTDRPEEPDALELCGEWTEEKEADEAFKRDDNIFMLN